MLFNSYQFVLLFLPAVLLGFYWIAGRNPFAATVWLAVASLFFYGWWNPRFVFLLLGSVAFNYALGFAIGRSRGADSASKRSTGLLAFAITANLLVLGFFKYTNFFLAASNDIAGTHFGVLDIVLPLGISFFTFTQIAFLVDVNRGIATEYSFVHYLLFVTYFPHLIAGPLLHHKQMMPQFADRSIYRINVDNLNVGLTMFAIGLFKKVMIADQFAIYSNVVFDAAAHGSEPKLFEAWAGALSYSLQIYFDFSGYSDMAIGLSKMFNVDLPINFNSPYKSLNIIDFWRRWHMTLSAFLRDYLYIPLGGNRHGAARRHLNLMVTMLLGGLWHGANWTFVLWGGLHGIYLVINHGWQALCRHFGLPEMPAFRFVAGTITFIAVVVAWVPFRAETIEAAVRILKGLAGANGITLPRPYAATIGWLADSGVNFTGLFQNLNPFGSTAVTIWVVIGVLAVWTLPNSLEITASLKERGLQSRLAGATIGAVFFLTVMSFNKLSPFIYFQF